MSAHDDPSDSVPMLPPGGVVDEVGEETMESVDAGLLGSSGVVAPGSDMGSTSSASRFDRTEPVEAEFVSDSDTNLDDTQASALDPAIEETVNFGSDTLAAMKAAATRKLGDFELERKIGQGGMGEVWLARQVSLDRPVAVKVLPRSLATQENFIERFQREAKAAASLVHPSVIQIYAYGIDEGTPYFAMEYVEGEDLQQRIRRERLLDWDEIVGILMAVTSALEVAHEKGIVHRDIKPSNIMIDKKGIVKVMDFGLAKATSGGPEAKSLTNAGLIMGTPNYLAPEQGRGDPLDGRSDLYSLGIVFYELLTGQLPFKADSPAGLIFKHVYEPPPPPLELRPEIPPFLVEITLKLLEKDPDDRYRNAQEFHDDLKSFYDNYDHYLEGGAALPPERSKARSSTSGVVAALPGRRPSPSSRRNAITEPVTKPIELTDVDDEPPPLDGETVLEAPESTEPAAADVQTKIAPKKRRKAPPPPKKKSKVPLLLLVLLLGLAGGVGYAWTQHNAESRRFLTKLGLLKAGDGPGPGASPSPLSSSVAVTTTPAQPSPSPGSIPQANEVNYSYEGEWPEGIEIRLARAKHDPIVLQRGSTGRYVLGDDYRITFARKGYQPISFPVSLTRRADEQNRGQLLDAEQRDVSKTDLTWKPSVELQTAYAEGSAALQAMPPRLDEAEKHLRAAASLDPGYRPPSESPGQVNRTVAELQKALETRREEFARADERLAQQVESAKAQAADLRWRVAIGLLEKWPKPEELPSEAKALLVQWKAKIDQGEEILTGVRTAIARGDHDAAAKGLGRIETVDRGNPDTKGLGGRLQLAKTSRASALSTKGELDAQLQRVMSYVSNFGSKDAKLLARKKSLEDAVGAARKLEAAYHAVKELAKAEKWAKVRAQATRLLRDNPDHRGLQTLKNEAAGALARAKVTATVKSLDEALMKGDAEAAIRLFDASHKEVYEAERAALRRMADVGTFVESTHALDSKIQFEGEFATVKSVWRFRLKLLDQPPRSFRAIHVISLRREGKDGWLIYELQVEGEIHDQ
jgi:serine/threonine protein kinase